MEVWKPVKGYEGLYEVSDKGNIKSLRFGGKIMKQTRTKFGYMRIELKDTNSICKKHYVHRIVLLAFLEINHKNGIKDDNRISNLEWVTRSENELHAYMTGLKHPHKTGATACKAVIRLSDGKGYRSQTEAADDINTDTSTMRRSIQNKRTLKGYRYEYKR